MTLDFRLSLYHDWLALRALLDPSKRVTLDGTSLDIASVVAVAKYGIILTNDCAELIWVCP